MSQSPDSAKNILGTQPITGLLLKYAVPSVISMVVMSLYNIVDQIFIAMGVGYLGNGATTVAFPLVTIALSISLLIGNGSAAFASLEMGRGKTDDVKKITGNAFFLMMLSGTALAVVTLCFLQPILRGLLSATEEVMEYAIPYTAIIAVGFPFSMLSSGMSALTRADGSPKFSMIATASGCLINVVLDPIFIFVFNMGVAGAAIATVLSQIISGVLILVYHLTRANHAVLRRPFIRFHRSITRHTCALGSSSFITQLANTIVNIVLNWSLTTYGALTIYGDAIPLSAMGIVMKINAILLSCILGVSIGAQPILGYNYGARNYGRVRRTYLTVICITGSASFLFWIAFITCPTLFVVLFQDENPLFNEFAALAIQTFLSGVFCAGLQIPSANYFQAVGKPLKAMTLTMSRQLLLLVPAILILPRFFGLQGILYSAPLADVTALLITSFFIVKEMRHLTQEHKLALRQA